MHAVTLSDVRALAALILLGLSLPCLALAYARADRVFRPDPGARRLVFASTAGAALLRWVIAPKQIVTVFIGYLLTQQAIELSAASHYGLGALALYHALFAVFPRDHATLLWANAVVGVLTLPLAAAFAARLLASARAGAIFATLVAVTPLFIKNDASDANQVPTLWWLFGALVLCQAYVESGERIALFASAPLFALAASARPEMPLLIPILVALLAPPRGRLRDRALYAAVALTALFVAPHVAHVIGASFTLEERGALPGATGGVLSQLDHALLSLNTVLTPSLYPVALLALAALGSALGPPASRWTRACIAIAAVIALGLYGVDLCRANMARVHVPGALLVTMLAASGVTALLDRASKAVARDVIAAAIAAVIALTAVPTARSLWAPTNEQAEEDFLRAALSRLPAEPYTLVRFDRADRDRSSPGSDGTHHHFPDYLIRPPAGVGRVSSIHDFIEQPDFDRPAFFYLGMRCYAELRAPDAPPPRGEALQPACVRMRSQFELEPVLVEAVRNGGDVWIEYYGDAKELPLGLYRIRARRGE